MHEEVLAKLPRIDTIRQDVRRQQAVNQPYSEIPENTLFGIPHPYNVSSTGEQFLHCDNRRDDRLVIFGARESFQFLQTSANWFMDGTFSTTHHNLPSYIRSMGLVMGKILLEPTACLSINEWKHTWSCFLESTS